MMRSSIQKLWPFCQLVLEEFSIFSIEEKETALIHKRIDQLPQNLTRVHNLVWSFDRNYKMSNFLFFPIVSIVFYCCLLPTFSSNFDTPLEVQDVH